MGHCDCNCKSHRGERANSLFSCVTGQLSCSTLLYRYQPLMYRFYCNLFLFQLDHHNNNAFNLCLSQGQRSMEALKALLAHGASVNVPNHKGICHLVSVISLQSTVIRDVVIVSVIQS